MQEFSKKTEAQKNLENSLSFSYKPEKIKKSLPYTHSNFQISRKMTCPCDGGCPRCAPVQTKLRIGEPDDEYEKEADRVAEQVMRIPDPVLQPKQNCPLGKDASCKEDEEKELKNKTLMKKEAQAHVPFQNPDVPPAIHEVLQSSGHPLDTNTRAFFEPCFGYDFSDVRIHNDAKAAESARAVNALAYTMGRNIVFGVGEYAPGRSTGRRLLAHELTHVIQQEQSGTGSPVFIQRQGISELMESARRRVRRIGERVERLGEKTEEKVQDIRELIIGGGTGKGDISKITFNGSQVEVIGTTSFTANALSGLLPNHPHAKGINYTEPSYQGEAEKGPIPEGDYYINPAEAESNPPGSFNISAWGRNRTRLHEVAVTTFLRRLATDRTGGFYLHEDANNNGTAGCIGLTSASDNARIHLLIRANTARIPVEVRYSGVGAPSVLERLENIHSEAEERLERIRQRLEVWSLQRRAMNYDKIDDIPPIVYEVLRVPGEPLEPPVRSSMETRFGQSFESVRIHADGRANRSAETVKARAYTVGNHVVFGSAQYQPATVTGRHLLAHELAHVIQQGSSTKNGPAQVNDTSISHRPANQLIGIPGISLGIRPTVTPISLQTAGPAAVPAVGAAVALLAACAYGFYRYALANYSGRQGYNDKFMHCYTSCKIASHCGSAVPGLGIPSLLSLGFTEQAGILKEVIDYIKEHLGIGTPADAEWEDWLANQYGIGCSLNIFTPCEKCCRGAPGAVAPAR